jgi:Zn-dependent protease
LAGIDLTQLLIFLLIILTSLTVHEAAHAWSADRLGDSTARMLGRVSLNPVVHVDPIGTLLFPLIAFMFPGAPVLGWAKPVPVNTANLGRGWKQKFMAIAAAGPASNLVLAAIGVVLFKATGGEVLLTRGETALSAALMQFIQTNVVLAVFNMLPIPPLDGGNVLSGLLRGQASDLFDRIRPYGFLILYVLMFAGILGRLIVPPARAILRVLLAIPV